MRLAFGDGVFDSELRQLMRGGAPVHLTPKALRLLEMLLERRPRPASKQEILDTVWPDAAVAEGSLANVVFEVRTALGDDPRSPRFIRTVHGFGYAFCGDAAEIGGAPVLREGARAEGGRRPGLVLPPPFRIVAPDGEFGLAEGENLVGRDPQCAVRIRSSTVSRQHARILVRGQQVLVEDLGSKNGTFVRGARIDRPTPIEDGEALQLGSIRATLRAFDPESSTDSIRLDLKEG